MFSIIIPVFNKAPYIDMALQSVVSQTFKEFELIVVDDGSTDNSLEMIKKTISDFCDNQKLDIIEFKLVEQINQGVSAARNNGVKVAKYDYIAFLDGDDWWEPTYLEEMNRLIIKYPSFGVFGSSYYTVTNGVIKQANIGVESGFTDGYIDYLKVFAKTMYMPLWTGSTIVRSDLFRTEKGFNTRLKAGEDFELWLRLTQKTGVGFMNKPLAYYNQDVDVKSRAVGSRLYQPSEHVIFCNFGDLQMNEDFIVLFEILAVYALLPYYLSGKFEKEVDGIISKINWSNHSFKYRLFYKILPKYLVKLWFGFWNLSYYVKKRIAVVSARKILISL
jgi:glycosyltransferase involved in cell wall biosynthesis